MNENVFKNTETKENAEFFWSQSRTLKLLFQDLPLIQPMTSLEDELAAISRLEIDTIISRAMALIETKLPISTCDKYATVQRDSPKKSKQTTSVAMQDDPSIYTDDDPLEEQIESITSSKRGVARKSSLKPRTGPRRYSSLSDVSSTGIYPTGEDYSNDIKRSSTTTSPIVVGEGPSTRTSTKVTKNGTRTTVTRTTRSVTSDNVGGSRTKATTISSSRTKNPHSLTPKSKPALNSPSTREAVNDRSLGLEPHIHVDEEDDDDLGRDHDNYTCSHSPNQAAYNARIQSGESFDNGYPSQYGGHGKEIVSRRSTEYSPHDLSPIRIRTKRHSIKKH